MDPSPSADQPIFRRVMLKLSGESFCRPGQGGLSVEEISRIARQAARVAAQQRAARDRGGWRQHPARSAAFARL